MARLQTTIGAGIAGLALIAAPGLALAQYDYHHHHHHHYRCRAEQRHDAHVGTAVGAVVGALAGHAIAGRGPGGVILGAGAGAVAGHEIGRSNHPC